MKRRYQVKIKCSECGAKREYLVEHGANSDVTAVKTNEICYQCNEPIPPDNLEITTIKTKV